jgi:uncharacterized membrane protein
MDSSPNSRDGLAGGAGRLTMSHHSQLKRIVDRLGDTLWIDRVANPAHQKSDAALAALGEARPELEGFLRGKWLGQPLHPMLVDIPIGAWTSATVFDVLALLHQPLKRAADVSLVLGLLAAPTAAAAGHSDWMLTTGRARRLGLVHGSLNTIAFLVYCFSAIARLRGKRGTGATLALLGMSIATVAGHLGGGLIFNEGVGSRPRERGREQSG